MQDRSITTPRASHNARVTPARQDSSPTTHLYKHNAAVTPRSQASSVISPCVSHDARVTPAKQDSSLTTPLNKHNAAVTPRSQASSVITPSASYDAGVTPAKQDSSPTTPLNAHTAGVTPASQASSTTTHRASHDARVTPVSQDSCVTAPVMHVASQCTLFSTNHDDVVSTMRIDTPSSESTRGFSNEHSLPTTLPCMEVPIYIAGHDIISIYHAVLRSGVPNYISARIALPTGFNIRTWHKCLHDYDRELCDFLEFGWPMDYKRHIAPTSTCYNHSSALSHSNDVIAYIDKERDYGALVGPFIHPPFQPWFQTNPLMTRPKKSSNDRRVIMDLSWPRDFSVNDGIDKYFYQGKPHKLTLPSVDDFVNLIVKHGPGCYLYSRDMARAYRQLRSDPLDWPLTGLIWDSKYYFDMSVPFGIRHGAACCQRTTNAVCHLMGKSGYDSLCYIDDFAGVEGTFDMVNSAYNHLHTWLHDLGIQENESKACAPTQVMTWIGITFDTVRMEMRIPPEKITEVLCLIATWNSMKYASRNQLQKLLGKLFFIAQCCKPARLFVNRMLDTLRHSPPEGVVSLSPEFQKDVMWFSTFLPSYNGVHLLQPSVPSIVVEADSCLTGCGAICGSEYYHTVFPDFVLRVPLSICHLEMLNIMVAVKLWSHMWKNKKVYILCDNLAAIQTLQYGRSRDHCLLTCAREIWFLSATLHFDIVPQHVPGTQMTDADALSRGHLNPSLLRQFDDHSRHNVTVPEHLFSLSSFL